MKRRYKMGRYGQIKAALPLRFFHLHSSRGLIFRLVTLTRPTICAVTHSLVDHLSPLDPPDRL